MIGKKKKKKKPADGPRYAPRFRSLDTIFNVKFSLGYQVLMAIGDRGGGGGPPPGISL